MAAAKAKKTASGSKRKAAKKTRRGAAKAAKKTKRGAKAAKAAKTAKTPRQKPASGASAPAAAGEDPTGLRVRMYRVGFGDFFLLSVPTPKGPKPFRHILVDCGVHAVDLGSIQDAVAQMRKDCGDELALVIMTHRHADHISGFGKCADAFGQVSVDRVWMPWFEDPSNDTAKKVQNNLTAMASQLALRLAARDSSDPHIAMVNNITGGMAASGVSANQKALDVLQKGFKNQPKHDYYRAGDPAILPQDLIDAGFSAQILGPPGDLSLITQMTNVNDQYLTDAMSEDDDTANAFPKAFRVDASAYPDSAFRFVGSDKLKALIDNVQPDVLAARAQAADKTLNNQSLVILFSYGGKNLLFVGDAQWGNWENFLYGGAFGTPGHTQMTKQATDILKSIDFYKVGHHGSRNATPKDAVAVMRHGCVGMCSTQLGAYNEVPREPLLQALRGRMDDQLARSDQIAANGTAADANAGQVPANFTTTGKLFIDYNFDALPGEPTTGSGGRPMT
jgi:beta-lactamase superfamily II metal-dependent hydrolase